LLQNNAGEFRFLIADPTKLIEEGENPALSWLTSKSWYEIKALDPLPTFSGIRNLFTNSLPQWKEIFDDPDASKCKIPNGWEENLTLFQRLQILRAIRPDSMSAAIQILIAPDLDNNLLNHHNLI
jgi:dynein heavy chain